jgi:sugar phosphate isomerase/epimerase
VDYIRPGYTRRDLGKLALAAVSAARLLAKPNSDFDGVQIGVIAPYSYRAMPDANDGAALLKHIVDNGLSAAELSPEPIEAWAGAPAPAPPATGAGRGTGPTPEQLAAAAALKKWRLSSSIDKFKAFRKLYNDAGVHIYEVRILPDMSMSDEEYEYAFTMAAAVGANQIGGELPTDLAHTQRLGDFAVKHKMLVAYHAHTQATLTAWDAALAQSKGNAAQLDCGHYVAGTGLSPIPVIEKLHDRMANMHLKDRTTPAHDHKNLAWGTGDTPLTEILQLMRKNKYKFPAAIELEYTIPAGSDAVTEVGKCVEYCRKALA